MSTSQVSDADADAILNCDPFASQSGEQDANGAAGDRVAQSDNDAHRVNRDILAGGADVEGLHPSQASEYYDDEMGDGGYGSFWTLSVMILVKRQYDQKEKPVSEKQLHLDKNSARVNEREKAPGAVAAVVKLIMQLRIEWVATCEDPTPSVPCAMYPEECPRPWQTFQVVFGGVFLNHY